MPGDWKFRTIVPAVLLAVTALFPTQASAITVEVAKKCNALLAKQFPPRQSANPAAGSTKGSGEEQRDFFKKCVASDGNMDGSTDRGNK